MHTYVDKFLMTLTYITNLNTINFLAFYLHVCLVNNLMKISYAIAEHILYFSYSSWPIGFLSSDMVCSVAGITSDANVLTNELRMIAQRYLLQYSESIPCEQLVSWLCDVKQAYTQYGGEKL
jgi:hypothetical protein